MDNPTINNFFAEVKEILSTRDMPRSYSRFERTCEEIQVALQLAATLSRDYVTISHEVFSAALNILSQHRQLEADLMELSVLRQRLEQQIICLKLSEERNIKWLEILRALSQKLDLYRRENHAISEGTLKLIARLGNEKLRTVSEAELTKQLQKVSKQIVRGDEPFSMKILTRLKRLEYHHAISQDVSSIQLIFSRMLMKRNSALKMKKNSLISCFSEQGPVVKEPQAIELLSRVITIGTTLHAEVKQLEEINRLMRIRQDLMYREYMERQNNTYSILWQIQMITAELNTLDEKNDRIVGKIVKTRPEFSEIENDLDRMMPITRPYSRRILRMHPDLFTEQEINDQLRTSSSEDGEEPLVNKLMHEKVYEPVLPLEIPEEIVTPSNLVSDIHFDGQKVISSEDSY